VDRWLEQQSNIQVLNLNYNDALDDPSRCSRDLAVFLDRQLDQGAMLGVVNKALHRQKT
jgi:hypothetical protein